MVLAVAMYMEMVEGLDPCPLCVLQRIIVIVLAIFFLVATLHGPRGGGVRLYSLVFFLISVLGIGIAMRQVWLQSLPFGQAPTCGPDISYMFNNMPLQDFLVALFKGTGDCAVVHWQFLNLSLAAWSAVFFGVLGFVHLWNIFRYLPKPSHKDKQDK